MSKSTQLIRTIMVIAALALAPALRIQAADSETEMDQAQSLYALRWVEAFRKLDARSNITMVLSNRDSLYELDHVVEIEAYSRFLVVRCLPPNGVSYRALVYPTTILLIKETPQGPAAAKPNKGG